uniref:Uncharacterized protein n=1 Tax=Parascaris equorum TaxID=6256 RepID=A0A914RDL3_PAREQ
MVGGAGDLAPGYRISTGDSRRLAAIEELIKEQRQLLLSLNAHFVCAVLIFYSKEYGDD